MWCVLLHLLENRLLIIIAPSVNVIYDFLMCRSSKGVIYLSIEIERMIELNKVDHQCFDLTKVNSPNNNSRVKNYSFVRRCGVGWNSIVRSGLCDGASGWASWENE